MSSTQNSATGTQASGTQPTGTQASGTQASGSQTGSASASATGSASGNATVSIPITAAAGALSVTQPPQTTVAFFKLASNQPITFAWSFSDVLSTPASLTVSAIGANGITYPVGPTDGVIPGTATSVVWDAWAFQESNPGSKLAQQTYTLNIHDERGAGAARAAGLLQANSALRFALYTPQPYTPLASGWNCGACRNEGTMFGAHPAFVSVFATILIMFLSGFALLRNGVH
ncbi:hypothetical protein OF83DRAFT_1055541 [Amylostereum chailletii]|nr:hypothetical protein OF83DRAFT_1055541 [Amylostereum chailletii]